MRKLGLFSVLAMSSIGLLTVAGWRGQAQAPPTIQMGDPLPGLTVAELASFNEGRGVFLEEEGFADGLGPVFNGKSCGECHLQGGVGGAGFDLLISRVTRIGGMRNGVYSDLVDLGGPVLERRSIKELIPECPINPEMVPANAEFVSRRISTPLFGLGLVEAIPNPHILRNADPFDRDNDGISGRANWVMNPETGQTEIGRFGWKNQVSSLHVFAADAYQNEMGITSPLFPTENLPQGQPFDAIWDPVPDPEEAEGDPDDIDLFADFMRFLAPPVRKSQSLAVIRGELIFAAINCGDCHVPALTTGAHSVAALANKQVRLYSDLLLHDMGPAFDDGVRQSVAKGGEWRTAPLWGISVRQLFLHDGRADTIDAAIQMHGGEATRARQIYVRLPAARRADVLAFLNSL